MRAEYVSSLIGKAWALHRTVARPSAAGLGGALLTAMAFGCTSQKIVTECEFGVDPATLNCRTSAPVDATAGDAGLGELQDTVTDPGAAQDTGPQIDDIADIMAVEDPGQVIAEDANLPPVDVKVDGVCNPSDPIGYPMNRRIGQPCTAHEQCETCYCYDEKYLSWGQNPEGGSFRFCTMNCTQGVGTSCADWSLGTDFEEFKCIRFVQQQIDDYEMKVKAVCLPMCQDVSDCEQYGPYDTCGSFWENFTISGVKHCQIAEPQ